MKQYKLLSRMSGGIATSMKSLSDVTCIGGGSSGCPAVAEQGDSLAIIGEVLTPSEVEAFEKETGSLVNKGEMLIRIKKSLITAAGYKQTV